MPGQGTVRCGEDRQRLHRLEAAAPGEAELRASGGESGDANAMADNEKNAVIVLDGGKHFNVAEHRRGDRKPDHG